MTTSSTLKVQGVTLNLDTDQTQPVPTETCWCMQLTSTFVEVINQNSKLGSKGKKKGSLCEDWGQQKQGSHFMQRSQNKPN